MKYEHYTPEAVILANGEYPSHPLPLQMLENAEFEFAVTGLPMNISCVGIPPM